MKLGFNEANDRFSANHSVMMDLELCEKYSFDCIDIQSECLYRYDPRRTHLPYPARKAVHPLNIYSLIQ